MFTVEGTVLGDNHTVTWKAGKLSGTPLVVHMLAAKVGHPVTVPPVGPTYTLDLSDPKSVMAALLDLTSVDSTKGRTPVVVPPPEPGVVY